MPRLGVLLVAMLVLVGSTIAQTPGIKLDVPFGPTSFTVVDTMLRIANVSARDFVIDLGSGDGRINIAAARDFGAPGVGFDLDPALVQDSIELAKVAGVADRVRFSVEDLFKADLSRATVITMYLGPEVTPRVRPKLLAESKPGTRLVSHNFLMGDWKPDLAITGRSDASRVYFWWVPARVAGTWRARVALPGVGDREYRFELRQTFQEVEGEVSSDGLKIALRDVRVEGERIRFLLQEQRGGEFTFRRFAGSVAGDAIDGHFHNERPAAQIPFKLTRVATAAPGPAGAWTYPR